MSREKVPTDPKIRNAWIKYQLAIRDLTFSDIAREGGVTNQTIRRTLDARYPKWDRIIASKIGLTPAEIWPERYAA